MVIMTEGNYYETSFAVYRKEITLDPVEAIRSGETCGEEALDVHGILGVAPEQIDFRGYPDGGDWKILSTIGMKMLHTRHFLVSKTLCRIHLRRAH